MQNRLILFFLLVGISSWGQLVVKGTVVDAFTKEPVPFANIAINGKESIVATSNIEGNFLLESNVKISLIRCTHIGYQSITMRDIGPEMVVNLIPVNSELEELVIVKTNTANKIIQKVLANKAINNPENLNSFTYKSYNKVVYDLKRDSMGTKFTKDKYLFMMESVSNRKFLQPNLSYEEIIATKVSGFKNPSFATIVTDFQPFSFYEDRIKLIDRYYINPISHSSVKKYRFKIVDTILNQQDTVYVLSFKLRENKNVEGLSGLLYINTNKYAVQNVIAKAQNDNSNISIKINQQYGLVEGKYWFPQQLNFQVIFRNFPGNGTQMSLESRSFIDDININVPLSSRDFPNESVGIDKSAASKDKEFWDSSRIETLNEKEMKTYRVIDSIGEKKNFDLYLSVFEKMAKGRLSVGYVDLDLPKFIGYNKYEGLRLGAGVITNERLSEKLSYEGFFGYGLDDRAFKYGYGLSAKLSEKHKILLGIKQQDNLIETGYYGMPDRQLMDFRQFIGFRFDRFKQVEARVGFSPFRYTDCQLSLIKNDVYPTYRYEFNTGAASFVNYANSEVSIKTRFAYKERVIHTLSQAFTLQSDRPIVTIKFSKGIKNLFDGNFQYNKLELEIAHTFHKNSFGQTSYKLLAGWIDTPLPYGMLFTGEGGFDSAQPFIMNESFQTLRPYEFLSDRYVRLFFSQNFGHLLFRSGRFKPDIIYHQNIEYGELRSASFHRFIEFNTPNKVFLESGVQMNNLIRMNWMNVLDLGYGAGIFYRYGAYSHTHELKNAVFKFTIALSLN